MRKKYIFGKKLYISLLTMLVVLITTVATTFAWVGVFANSTFDQFEINIEASSLDEYGVIISSTGEPGTFSDNIPEIEIKKQILQNWGFYDSQISTPEDIEKVFSTISMDQCTNSPIITGNKIQKLGEFRTIENFPTKRLFKFDIYVAPEKFYDNENSSSSDYLLDVFLENDIIKGTERYFKLGGDFTFPTSFINPLKNLPNSINKISGGTTIKEINVNSASAARVAFEKYEVVDFGSPSQYDENSTPISTIIYTGDKYNYPTINTQTDIYEFGGILPDNINMSTNYYNYYDYRYQLNGIKSVSVPSNIMNTRGVGSNTADKVLTDETSHLIDSSDSNEHISLGKMMKLTIYMWFEGWDADCFNVINSSPITLDIRFNVSNKEFY